MVRRNTEVASRTRCHPGATRTPIFLERLRTDFFISVIHIGHRETCVDRQTRSSRRHVSDRRALKRERPPEPRPPGAHRDITRQLALSGNNFPGPRTFALASA